MVCTAFLVCSVNAQSINLPKPKISGGMPLHEALSKRETCRNFEKKELTLQQISDLLWAAFGINRPDGKRTAPSAMNYQEIDLYVLLAKGSYRYHPKQNILEMVNQNDIRYFSGQQDQIKDAPVHVILVADLSKMGNSVSIDKTALSYADAGHISQNIYLFVASEGLATGIRHWIDKKTMSSKMYLKPSQSIILAHSIGYKKKEP